MKQSKRKSIFKRDKHRCMKCGGVSDLTVDHIIPKALGGDNTNYNLQTLCLSCNRQKADTIGCYVNHKKVLRYVQEHLQALFYIIYLMIIIGITGGTTSA